MPNKYYRGMKSAPGKMRNRGEDGFTLIELVIVVAIVAVLVAIAVPAFESSRRQAYNASAFSDVRQFKQRMEAYWADYDSYPPFGN